MACCFVQEFGLLLAMGATEVEPRLQEEYSDPETWCVLHERWAL